MAILSGSGRAIVDSGRFQEWPNSPSDHASDMDRETDLYGAADGAAHIGNPPYYSSAGGDESTVASGFYNKDRDKPWRRGHRPSAPPMFSSSDADVKAIMEVLEAEPPLWLPDSSAQGCMQCGSSFRPLTCGRHHCRFCGGIFCRSCSAGRCLLPVKFRERNPQRVCDACFHRLEPVQRNLADRVSNASQSATFDVTDMTCMRGWLNSPYGFSMEQEIYKATNTVRSYCKIGNVKPEQLIPDAVLKGARGLAIVTVVKGGMIMTYKIGTGLVVARRTDGTWSAPSAIGTCGLGWGCQAGGELTDFIIVLRNKRALKTFCNRVHFSLGAGLSAAIGPVGRVIEADIRASTSGTAACYTYSCSKGAFVGVSLEGNVVATRIETNMCFYGDPLLTSAKLLFGHTPRPRAGAPLYSALNDLFGKVEQRQLHQVN
eukprot:TRINITY_DN26596_c0_g1_i1.p1 TRINITY_DN26596_c0_g1~~TRINITY_DN26596_c0_g1_i1.p1  ORF type:complete len:480 (-),score=58.90 TRINITY_DN26596_c0_g1_i1:245-1534(-)